MHQWCVYTSLFGTLGPSSPLPVLHECSVPPSLLEAKQQHLDVHVSGMQEGTGGYDVIAVGTGILAYLSSLWVDWPFSCYHEFLI